MSLGKLWTIAYRDLGRNRRRTGLSLLAVALGLALLIMLNGLIAGVMADAIQNAIRLRTGHVQLRAESYEEGTLSLASKNLLQDVERLAARAAALPGVTAATPVLWANAVLNTADESVGLQLIGIEPGSAFQEPIRQAIVAGEFLAEDDRDGVLVGQRLADELGLGVGQKLNLAIVDADGQASEGPFTIRGLLATAVPSYDESAVMMSLSRAQAFTGVRDRASAIVMLLDDQEEAPRVAAALGGPGLRALTYADLNAVALQAVQTSLFFYKIIDAIVMFVVAVIIANTLLMAVFERIREIGILAALGLRRRQILLMFLLEAAILGLAGVALGFVLGLGLVAYLVAVGIPIGDMGVTTGNAMAIGSTMHGRFEWVTFAWLAWWTLVVILLGSLYPAWFAARLEPAEALHRS